MKKILANDGIDATGKQLLEQAGFTVLTDKVAQDQLVNFINEHAIDVLTVRSATKVRKDLIDACYNLKIIARGGVGMDNIDVTYAQEKGIAVINTPAASSLSVAELVFAHLFGLVRFLHISNRQMPIEGITAFDSLKKQFANGIELRGKTMGIIGFGRIGQEVAKIAIGLGMKVAAADSYIKQATLELPLLIDQKVSVTINTVGIDAILSQSDFITLHVPGGNVISDAEIAKLKKGVVLINAARGGVIDEAALVTALNNGTIAAAALDVFTNEPTPEAELLSAKNISLTPHIGAATVEAQARIGVELAERIIAHFS